MRRNHFQEWILDDMAGVCKIKATRAQRKIEVRTMREGERARRDGCICHQGSICSTCGREDQRTRRGEVSGWDGAVSDVQRATLGRRSWWACRCASSWCR
jgi:hypothetical protein